MKLVINISESQYEIAKKYAETVDDKSSLAKAIANGIPLPQGHDRLIEESEIERVIDGVFYSRDIYYPDMFLNILKDQCITFLEADRSEE